MPKEFALEDGYTQQIEQQQFEEEEIVPASSEPVAEETTAEEQEEPQKNQAEADWGYKAQIERLEKEVRESRQRETAILERYQESLTRQQQQASRPDVADEREPTPDEFLEDLTKKGPAAITALLKRTGMLTKADVDALVQSKIAEAREQDKQIQQQNAAFFGKYPELEKPNTETKAAFQEAYQQVAGDFPEFEGNPGALLRLAGERMRTNMALKQTTQQNQERNARITAQSSGTGRGADGKFQSAGPVVTAADAELLDKLGLSGREKEFLAQKGKR